MNLFSARPIEEREGTDGSIDPRKPSTKEDFWHLLRRPVVIQRAVAIIDAALIVACGLASSIGYHWYVNIELTSISLYASASILVSVNFVLLISVQHGYRLQVIANPLVQLRLVLITWMGLFAGLLAIAFAMKVSEGFSRGAIILFFGLGFIVIAGWKLTAARWTSSALLNGTFNNGRLILITEAGLAATSASLRSLNQHGYRPAHTLEISPSDLSSPMLMSLLKLRLRKLVVFARQNRIEQIFLLLDWGRTHAIDSILDALKVLPVPVYLVPDADVSRYIKFPVVDAGAPWAVELRRAPLTKSEQFSKRVFDLIGASLALLLFSPIMCVAALLVKCTSPGPVLFRQTRNGFNGRAFRIYKFRSMRVTEDGPNIVQATRNDNRVTRIGRWLRKTSIDELPQLFNVLAGDMSLVGPRPHAAAHNNQYQEIIGNYAYRHHVKPGITGWAQVNGSRGETKAVGLMEKRVEYDLWYINNWSLWLDVRIVLGTALMAFQRGAAY